MTATTAPVVSIVVPMLDEIDAIDDCLDGFARQTHPRDRLEVLVVDGGSTDGSREHVLCRAAAEPWIRVVDNPARRASAAFNCGLNAANGDVVCLFSAHGVPSPDYVERSVAVLDETGAAGVGGRYEHVGVDPVSRAVGLAMESPFGMASPHRLARTRCDVDTISHPAYRRAAMLEVGLFDETLMRNSDYEYNWRMSLRGHRLVFDPSVQSIYRPRTSLKALGRQFWWYGRWKARVVRRHPKSMRLRHLVAPAFVAGIVASPIIMRSAAGRRGVVALGVLYGAGVIAATTRAKPREHDASAPVLAASFPLMHISWGAGFLTSIVEDSVAR